MTDNAHNDDNAGLDTLLEYLRRSRGFDFSSYKRSTLSRRVAKRMYEVGVDGYADYLDYLEVHSDEFGQLFNTILINVTAFFRDDRPWAFLRDEVVPRILKNNRADMIRVWSAGCSSGEEAYSLAMVFAEALGEAPFRSRLKIYATDIDDEALAQARQGLYSIRSIQQVPPEYRDRYFDAVAIGHVFRADLRRSIIFGRHDLTRDAPISRLDLLVCRNTLMYFNAEAQKGIIRRLHFAMAPTGFLFLGRAETLMSHSTLFQALNAPARIFAKFPTDLSEDRTFAFPEPPLIAGTDNNIVWLRKRAFQTGLQPQIVLDSPGRIVAVNQKAQELFSLDERDYGRLFQDVEVSYRPVELRAPIDQAINEHRVVLVGNVEHSHGTEPNRLDVSVVPLIERNQVHGVAITFMDVTRERSLEEELNRATEELETAYEELQSSNEELETTNEELQSTVEELETTNEELQSTNEELRSTNEELETTNEELRSTNEELETMNEELRISTAEVDQGNAFLSSVVNSLNVGVVVLDLGRQVRTWNRVAEELWGLRADEVADAPFFELDIGLPVDQLGDVVDRCLNDLVPGNRLLPAVNRRGRAMACQVTCTPIDTNRGGGALIVMQEVPDGIPAEAQSGSQR
ncbi:MAG: CheR family methyltransferase [Mycobacteriaceae bacterium]